MNDKNMEELTSEFYDIEMIPVKASANNKTGITFKGSCMEYLNAHKNILELVKKKGERFVINGIEIGIVDNPENKPVCVEIKPKSGLSGKVNLSVFGVNDRKSATIMVNKKAGGNILHMKTLGIKIIKYLLDNFCTGQLFLNDIELLKKKLKTEENISHPCQNCDKIFQSKQGLNLHVRRIHKDTLITCEVCPKTFISKPDLSQHIQEAHTGIVSPVSKKLKKSESIRDDVSLDTMDIENGILEELLSLESESWEERRFDHRKVEVIVNEEEENVMKEYENEERIEKVKNEVEKELSERSKLHDAKVLRKQKQWNKEENKFKEKMEKTKVEEAKLSCRQKKNRKRMRKNRSIKEDSDKQTDESQDEREETHKTATHNHRYRPTTFTEDNEIGPGYVGWRNDFEDLKVAFRDLEKKNHELKAENDRLAKKVEELEQNQNTDESKSARSFKNLRMEFKKLKEDFIECMNAVEEETYARAKAEAMAKTLKDTLEAKNKLEDQAMEIDHQIDSEKVANPSKEEWTIQRKQSSKKNKKQEKQYYECTECKFLFESEVQLRIHAESHITNILDCSQCEEKFDNAEKLKKHNEDHIKMRSVNTNIEENKCNKCGRIFLENNDLNKHLEHICTKCLETFCKESELKKHKEKHENPQIFECEFCEVVYQEPMALKEHLRSHTVVKETENLKCNQCGLSFKDMHEFQQHLETHKMNSSNQDGIKCSKCEKVYATMSKLRRHDWRSHRRVECTICGEGVSSRQDISKHRQTKHNITAKSVCKFFPNCIDEEECFFVHKITNTVEERNDDICPKGENCTDQSCTFSEWKHKSSFLCKFQTNCTRINCNYKHKETRKAFLGQGSINCIIK